jgi:hypothetical protein
MPDETKTPTRLRDLAEKGGHDVLMFDPRKIIVEPGHNPRRFDTPEMRERMDILKESIRQEYWPHSTLLVRWEPARKDAEGNVIELPRAVLVDGETRLRCVMELIAEGEEILKLPVQGVDANNEAQRILLALNANTGRPLTQMESGTAFRRLRGYGWSVEQIAAKVGHSVRYVNDAIALNDAPLEVQRMVMENVVTPGRAIAEVKEHGTRAAETLAPEVEKAKANGAGPVKRKKAAPVAPVDPRQELINKLAAEVGSSVAMAEETESPWISVSANLVRQLVAFAEVA